MMMPSVRDNFFKGFMNPMEDMLDFTNSFFDGKKHNVLKTDIKEVDGNYELDMELPGYKKEEIKAKVENGYLTILANQKEEKDKKDNKGNYIRRERYQGSVSRSFYVGDSVKQEEIKAKFDNGVLHLMLPKKEVTDQNKENYISIEG